MTTLLRAKFPKKHVIVQSFWPANLQVARKRWPGVATSFLTLKTGQRPGDRRSARASRPPGSRRSSRSTKAFVTDAHAKHFKVVPFTLDRKADVKAAKKAGVDALITDDPFMALKALGRRIPR